ncbi:fatty-acid peroxygenase [Hymenobacter luteus]|uniref:Fatty-acid peroxygenase n=2 Tax=Hymenobacter TaxID=89966 RepID=A0A7W9T1L4_9BACT|nr:MULTISPECIES: cytochrome P450 [Hymenobacter]MBB4600664.1 fatty-acid peroxygenase [Hymenobacter latericoloratus]MBB6059129.1 fatty-acid peroxygenase [Hymenobacter luteus]
MPKIFRDPSFDSTLDVLREGYPFLYNRSQRFNSDIFQIRLMGLPAICLHGAEAAELFYNPKLFIRKGAVPRRVQTTLMGLDAIQTRDNGEHRCRKEMFMALMGPASRQRLMSLLAEQWQRYAHRWEKMDRVVLFREAQEILCRAACAWAEVPLAEEEVSQRARDFGDMVDGFGGVGPRHWRGKQARSRGEKWMRGIIRAIRKGQLPVQKGSPAHMVAWYRDTNGELLDVQMAAIELMNATRPIVAIATYITFAALALHEHPAYRQLLRNPAEDYAELFVQEVRRYFPFTPFVGALVREEFTWHGFEFPKGTLVLLDVYGTNRDEREWQDPEVFWPERFRQRKPSPYDFIPQGGGEFLTGHRCAGEWITIEALKQAVAFLNDGIRYDVPAQDLRYNLTRMPTLPASGFVLTNVQATGKGARAALPMPAAGSEKAAAMAMGCPFHKG